MSVRLFDSGFLKQLEYLSLVSRRVFRGSLLAQRRTMQSGGGVEFAGHRAYAPGDDFRYMDWNVFARHGELLFKRFQEEQDLHVYFLLDCSRSMDFGSPVKFDLARQIVAALAYIALADLDRISVVAFSDSIIADFPLTRGRAQIVSLLKFLEGLTPQGTATDLARVLGGFTHRTQRRGLVLLVSDLFDPAGFEAGLDLLRHRRYEPSIVQVFDPREADPGLKGDLELYDLETDATRHVTISERSLERYRQVFAAHQASIRDYCRRHGIVGTRASTALSFEELILKMMRAAGAVQ